MNHYLMIQNRGVCPPQGFTVLGASTTRADESNDPYAIGQFGSGNKHGVILCLRHRLTPIVFCSNLRMEFSTRPEEVNDGIKNTQFARVVVKYSGKDESGRSKTGAEDLGYVLDYGRLDWDRVEYGLREFVSNAIDREIRQEKHENPDIDVFRAAPWRNVKVEIVGENQVRAKTGYTRVFIPLTPAVLQFKNDLGKWFLHFGDEESLNKDVLLKKDRNLSESNRAVIYRRGVLVRELGTDKPSLFDYNLNNIQIDESRKINDHTVKYEAGRALGGASADILAVLLRAFDSEQRYWEQDFGHYELVESWENRESKEKKQKRWGDAFIQAFEANTVLCDNERDEELLIRKGYRPRRVSNEWLRAAVHYDLKTAQEVLGIDERAGRQISPYLESHFAEAQRVWSRLRSAELTAGKPMPDLYSFVALMDGEAQLWGFQRDSGVYLHKELSGVSLTKVILEEFGHYITGSTDLSRDFQDWAFRVAAYLLEE